MKNYEDTTTSVRLAAAALALAIAVGLLEMVTGGFVHPDPLTVAARRDWIAARAEQVARARALADGAVKSASSAPVPGI